MEFGRQYLSLLNWIAHIYSSFKSTKHSKFPLATLLQYCKLAQKIWQWGTFGIWFYKDSFANIHCTWKHNTKRSNQFRSFSGIYLEMYTKHRRIGDEINNYNKNAPSQILAKLWPIRTNAWNVCKYYPRKMYVINPTHVE